MLPEILELTSAENAVITVLLLHGIQPVREIKQSTERLHPVSTPEQVEEILEGFIEYPNGPLVTELPAGGGRRVRTYAHLLGGETELGTSSPQSPSQESDAPARQTETDERLAALEFAVEKILNEIGNLKEELGMESGD